VDWFSNNKPGSPVPVIVEIEVGGTDYRLTDFNEEELNGLPGRFQMENVRVTVMPDLGEEGFPRSVLSQLHLTTPEEMVWVPKIRTDRATGLLVTVWHSRWTTRKIAIDSGELPLVSISSEGVRVAQNLFGWDDGAWNDDWDWTDHVEIYAQGKPVRDPHALSIHQWRAALGPLAEIIPAKINFALYMAMHGMPEERQLIILGLLQELDLLIHYGDTSPIASSPEQFILAMTREPERILDLALALPWERALHLTGPASLMLWLEENHPQSPCRKPPAHMPEEPAETEEKAEWPPNNMRIFLAMRASQMAGTFSQSDADRMDEGPPETWPLEIWQKLGFAPPSPPATDETLTACPPSNLEPSDQTSGNLNPAPPITAVVNIHATGELYRITQDTKSDPCDGEEVLVYDFVKVEVVVAPQNEDDTPHVLESVVFRPEDEDFPLRHMPPAQPHIGQVLRMNFWSNMQTEIQLGTNQPSNVRIARSGVTVADHHFSWGTIHEQGNLDQSDLETAYFHGVMLCGDMADLIFDFRHASSNPKKTIIRHLADEIDFIAAHTRADGFDGTPAGLVDALNDDPDILMQSVLAMPWDYARRICGPAEVAQWIEENHPGSPGKHVPQRQEPPTYKTVNSSYYQNPSSPHEQHPPTMAEISIGYQPLPEIVMEHSILNLTRLAPQEWPQEVQEAMRPYWKDKDGNPLPWDQPMCDLKGNPNYPDRMMA
jgi:hypothetical protein